MGLLTEVAEPLLPRGSRRRNIALGAYKLVRGTEKQPPIPAHIISNYRTLTAEQDAELAASICTNYFGSMEAEFGPADEYAASDAGRSDIESHLHGRMSENRRTIVPWLDSVRALDGANILEVGAGLGDSTVCLAEQGAHVTAVDVHAEALRVTTLRSQLMRLQDRVRVVEANGATIDTLGQPGDFDLVIFFASVEHMTIAERIEALKKAWGLLKSGQQLVVIETPNRLWWLDDHTSMAPFFHWLPDDLALLYAPLTPRQHFNQNFTVPRKDAALDLARWGRGASFHEFELALGIPAAQLPVSSWICKYLRCPHPQFIRELIRLAPEVPVGFLFPWLNVSLQR